MEHDLTYTQSRAREGVGYGCRPLAAGIVAGIEAVAVASRAAGLRLLRITFATSRIEFGSNLGIYCQPYEKPALRGSTDVVCSDFARIDVVTSKNGT